MLLHIHLSPKDRILELSLEIKFTRTIDLPLR